jgi:uncharacterized RDD family membrane protein YckC
MSDDKNLGDKNSIDAKSDDEQTPLERYLAKQKAAGFTGATTGQADSGSSNQEHDPAIEAGAPAYPPPSSSRFIPKPEPLPISLVPAEFWPRVGAFLLDSIIVSFLATLLSGVSSAAFFFLPHIFFGFWPLARIVVIFFYYGWFYAEKGASPGKLLLGLEIREAGTGRRLSYMRTFLRETIGKMISGAILGIGFLIVAFREDRRSLHDMMFDTRVFRRTDKV